MTGTTPWQAQDNVEPIASATISSIANMAYYSTVSGCAATYSAANLNVTIASGATLHNTVYTAVAGASVTLVADPTNPRWTYGYINSAGTPAIVSGSAAATPAIPDPGANATNFLVYVQQGLTIADNATYKLDKRVFAPAGGIPAGGIVTNYKSATQVFTTNTTFADVTGAKGSTFSFSIGANEVWEVEYWIPLAFGGTGGAKFQITGPAAPTNVDITGTTTAARQTSSTDGLYVGFVSPITRVTAFSSDIAAADSVASTNAPGYYTGNPDNIVYIRLRIINGANAGTVTLQAAQNSSNSTTTLGLGSTMTAKRII